MTPLQFLYSVDICLQNVFKVSIFHFQILYTPASPRWLPIDETYIPRANSQSAIHLKSKTLYLSNIMERQANVPSLSFNMCCPCSHTTIPLHNNIFVTSIYYYNIHAITLYSVPKYILFYCKYIVFDRKLLYSNTTWLDFTI